MVTRKSAAISRGHLFSIVVNCLEGWQQMRRKYRSAVKICNPLTTVMQARAVIASAWMDPTLTLRLTIGEITDVMSCSC